MGRTNLLFPLTFSYHEALKQNSVRPLQKIEEYCRNIETSGIGNGSKTSTTNEIINLVKAWRDGKRQELHFVNVASTIQAGLTVSVFSWPSIAGSIWVAKAMWYTSLFMAVLALITSSQQSSLLQSMPLRRKPRAQCVEDVQRILSLIVRGVDTSPSLPHLARKTFTEKVQRTPSKPAATSAQSGPNDVEKHDLPHSIRKIQINHFMLFIWQCPLMLMSHSWVLFLVALTLHVCTPLIEQAHWSDDSKVGIFYLAVGGVLLLNFIFCSFALYGAIWRTEKKVT